MADPTIVLKILADVKKAVDGIGKVAGSAGGLEKAFSSMALPAGAALGAIAGGAAIAAKKASDLEQSAGAVEAVFKGNSDAVKKFAKDAAKSTGLASADYQQMAAILGAQLKGMGVPSSELAGKTDALIRKGSDLAAMFGGDTSQAVEAISALLRGERDPIEKYGVSIKEADVAARLAADGITKASKASSGYAKASADVERAQAKVESAHAKTVKAQERLAAANKDGTPKQVEAAKAAVKVAKGNEAAAVAHYAEADAAKTAAGKVPQLTTDQEKAAAAAATLALLTDKTADAQGAFGRETDTAAHAQQVANAQITDATAALGAVLLPIIVTVTGKLGEMAGFVKDNATVFQILIGIVAALATAILVVNAAYKLYQTWTLIVTAAQWLFNAALDANPIGIIILLIAGLIAGIVLLWQNSETFRTIVTGVFNTVLGVVQGVVKWITDNFAKLGAILSGPWKVFSDAVAKAVAIVRSIIGALSSWIDGIFKGIRDAAGKIGDAIDAVNPFGVAPPPASGRMVAGAWTRGAARSGGGGGPITVNVYTTGDSIQAEEAVVRAVRRAQRLNAGRVLPSFGLGTVTRNLVVRGPDVTPS